MSWGNGSPRGWPGAGALPPNNITGSGTVNQIPKFTGANVIGDSIIDQAGNAVTIRYDSSFATLNFNCYSATTSHRGQMVFFKAHSTARSYPFATTVDGEELGRILWNGVATDNWNHNSAKLKVVQNGAAGASYIPSNMTITTYSASGENTDQIILRSNGNIYMENDLEINGNLKLTGNTIQDSSGGTVLAFNASHHMQIVSHIGIDDYPPVGGIGIQAGFSDLTGVGPVGYVWQAAFPSTATSYANVMEIFTTTANASFTIPWMKTLVIPTATKGASATVTNYVALDIEDQSVGSTQTFSLRTGTGKVQFGGNLYLTSVKTGATQGGAGAAATEVWATSSHATLPDDVLMLGT